MIPPQSAVARKAKAADYRTLGNQPVMPFDYDCIDGRRAAESLGHFSGH
jgi:hypothetical protein